jgi:hypothetical protein
MTSDPDLNPEDYTVAWIAPLEVEAQAAWHMLDHQHPGRFTTSRGDDYVYAAGDINGHNVVIATFPAGHDYGVGSAAAFAASSRIIQRRYPRYPVVRFKKQLNNFLSSLILILKPRIVFGVHEFYSDYRKRECVFCVFLALQRALPSFAPLFSSEPIRWPTLSP